MPKSSLADFVTDWETLLKNVSDTAADLPNLDVYKAALEPLLASAKDGIALSQAHRGLKQQQTKDLQELIGKGKDAAIKLRSAVRAHFGPKSEMLLKFGMTPIRKRKKAPVQAAQTAKEPEPERVVIAQPPLDRIVYHGRTIAVYPAAGVDWKSLINIRIFETLRPGMNFAEARARLGPPNLASRNHMGLTLPTSARGEVSRLDTKDRPRATLRSSVGHCEPIPLTGWRKTSFTPLS